MHDKEATHSGSRRELDAVLATVIGVLEGMGAADVGEDSVLAAPPFYDGPLLLESGARFSQFMGQLAVNLRFVGYSADEVAFLSVRQLCEMFVADSFPEVPAEALADDQYELHWDHPEPRAITEPKEFPICFILGAPRSGTTLLRAMLNVHSKLWAPGELHLATFATLADRAPQIAPVLRYMPIPEAASRCSESIVSFSQRFRAWERAAAPFSEVYQFLYDADPGVMIVDKSPPYAARLRTLERIGAQFPNARFVHLLRSPHDMIRSYVRIHLHRGDQRLNSFARNPYHLAEAIWFACNANSEAFLTTIPDERKCVVRYEELTHRPEDSLQRICALLDEEFEEAMANPYAAPGPTASGAGDLHIHLLKKVEHRDPITPFFPLGARGQKLADRLGYS